MRNYGEKYDKTIIFLYTNSREGVVKTTKLTCILGILALSALVISPGIAQSTQSISVNSNDDLVSLGLPGSGTENDPYILSSNNLEINDQSAIEIKNTDLYLVIRDNIITGMEPSTFLPVYGIHLYNTTNVIIENNNLTSIRDSAIYVEYSDNITIRNNTIAKIGDWGISFYYTNDVVILNNTLTSIGRVGISGGCYSCSNVSVVNNIVTNSSMGIFAGQGFTTGNTLFDNEVGISLSVTNATIFNNTLSSNKVGIELNTGYQYGAIPNYVYNNTIEGNALGVRSHYTTRTFFTNNMIRMNSYGVNFTYKFSDFEFLENTVTNNTIGGMSLPVIRGFVLKNNTVNSNGNYDMWLGSESEAVVIFRNDLENSTIIDEGESNIFEMNYWGQLALDDSDSNGVYDSKYGLDPLPLVSRDTIVTDEFTTPVLYTDKEYLKSSAYFWFVLNVNEDYSGTLSSSYEFSVDGGNTWIQMTPSGNVAYISTRMYEDQEILARVVLDSGTMSKNTTRTYEIRNRELFGGKITSPSRSGRYYNTLNVTWFAGYVDGNPPTTVTYNLYFKEYSLPDDPFRPIAMNISGTSYAWDISGLKRTSYTIILETVSEIGSVNDTVAGFWVEDQPTSSSTTSETSSQITNTTSSTSSQVVNTTIGTTDNTETVASPLPLSPVVATVFMIWTIRRRGSRIR